jgi:hypothetical protein
MSEQTLREEIADEIEDDHDRRSFEGLADIRQTHLSERWWSS